MRSEPSDSPAHPPAGSFEREARSYNPAVAISNGMVRLLAQYVGRGPTKARTTLNTNIVVVTFGETMTRAEHNLVAAGEADAVSSMRRVFHATMRDEAVRTVEEAVGRTVVAYMADIDTQANIALMAFVLEPEPESYVVEVGSVSGELPEHPPRPSL